VTIVGPGLVGLTRKRIGENRGRATVVNIRRDGSNTLIKGTNDNRGENESLSMASEGSRWFKAVEFPSGWSYDLSAAERECGISARFFLGGIVVPIVIGMAVLGYSASSIRRSGWTLEWAFPITVGMLFLATGGARAIRLPRARFGRDELRLDAEAIRVVGRLGPIAWTRSVPWSKAAQLTVVCRS
jgi:hypothetical protein